MLLRNYSFPRRKVCQLTLLLLVAFIGGIIFWELKNSQADTLLSDSVSSRRTFNVIQDHPEREKPKILPLFSTEENIRASITGRGITMRDRRNFVKGMMKFAWDNYVRYAWEYNELHPNARTGSGGAGIGEARLGATIIDSLDTLKIMGLNEEFTAAEKWVSAHFDVAGKSTRMSVFEANIRLLGGLLSAHALTTNKVFLEKAIEVGDILAAAFNGSPSGFPYSLIETSSLHGSLYTWLPGECVSLADVGTLDMEFAYLSQITGNPLYLEKVEGVRRLIKHSRNEEGLYPNLLSYRNTGGTRCPGGISTTVGAFADSFYEYLFKSWLLSGKTDNEAKVLFDNALVVLERRLLQTSSKGLKYFAKLEAGHLVHNVEHLACFIGGLYALSAHDSDNEHGRMELAKDITKTCHESYDLTRTKIGPEAFVFDDEGNPRPASDAKQYSLRPEVVESYYYLWKKTGDVKYQDWAWEAAKAIERHCRKTYGYTGIHDVNNIRSPTEDIQQSFFMAETLKYLYLTFLEDDPLDLDTWVFNTEAHPLPVIGSEPFKKAFLAWRGQAFSSDFIIHRN